LDQILNFYSFIFAYCKLSQTSAVGNCRVKSVTVYLNFSNWTFINRPRYYSIIRVPQCKAM